MVWCHIRRGIGICPPLFPRSVSGKLVCAYAWHAARPGLHRPRLLVTGQQPHTAPSYGLALLVNTAHALLVVLSFDRPDTETRPAGGPQFGRSIGAIVRMRDPAGIYWHTTCSYSTFMNEQRHMAKTIFIRNMTQR
jgi:hypothetical protein